MLEQAKYVNHLGEVVEFGKNGIFANENDLRNYAWLYDTGRRRAENFHKGVVNKTIPVVIVANSKEERAAIKNTMYEVFAKDISANKQGKLYIDDFYLECKIYGTDPSNYLISDTTMNASLKVVSDTGNWYRNIVNEYRYAEHEKDASGYGYPYCYEYDYTASGGYTNTIENEYFDGGDFIMTIHGYAMNPEVNIAGHSHKMNCTVQKNERLIINSIEKTIKLIKANGVVVNMFSRMDKTSYIFEKIPSGTSSVYWNGDFDFDIEIRVERGEPLWM